MEILKIKIRVDQHVRKVWIRRKQTPPGNFQTISDYVSMDQTNPKPVDLFAYFLLSYQVRGPYCYPPLVGESTDYCLCHYPLQWRLWSVLVYWYQ